MGKKARSAPMPMMDKDYQAEDDHRTLTRAQEITGDHSRMRNVKRHHTKMTKSLSKVGGLFSGRR